MQTPPAPPPQQLHCRCSHTCICNSCLLTLFGFPYLRRCSCLFFRMKSYVNYIYQSKVSPTSFTWIDIQLIASITQGTSLTKKKNMIYWSKCHSNNLLFISFLLPMLVLSWSSLVEIFLWIWNFNALKDFGLHLIWCLELVVGIFSAELIIAWSHCVLSSSSRFTAIGCKNHTADMKCPNWGTPITWSNKCFPSLCLSKGNCNMLATEFHPSCAWSYNYMLQAPHQIISSFFIPILQWFRP